MLIPPPRGLFGLAQRAPCRIVDSQTPGAPPDRAAAIEMTASEHAQADTTAPPALLVDLEMKPVETHRVVPGDDALFLMTEDLLQVRRADRHEGAGGIGGRVREGRVVVGEEALAQIAVGGGHCPKSRPRAVR